MLRRFISLLLPVLMLCGATACVSSPVGDAADKQSAERLFADFEKGGVYARAVELYEKGKYRAALEAFRDEFITRVRPLDFGEFNWHASYPGYDSNIQLLCGNITYDEFIAQNGESALFKEYYWNIAGDPSKPLDPAWLGAAPDGTFSDCWMRFFTAFPASWLTTGDDVVMQKYFQIMSAFSLENKTAMQNAEKDGYLPDYEDVRNGRADNYLFSFTCAFRSEFMIRQLAAFAKLLPDETGKKPDWAHVLSPVAQKPDAKALSKIPAARLADIIWFLLHEQAPYLYDTYCTGARHTPNQQQTGLADLVLLSLLLPDSAYVRDVLSPGLDAEYTAFVESTNWPDGGLIEQAFNYNLNDYNAMKVLDSLVRGLGQTPEYASAVTGAFERLDSLFTALKKPMGGLPVVGLGESVQSAELWKKDAAEEYKNSSPSYDVKKQDYTSKQFPYSGYYVMRSGWEIDDLYLFMQSPRRTNGHLYPSNGSYELIYGGRYLLMNGGAPWYTTENAPAELLSEFDAFNNYFEETSSFNRNTVIVGGFSQNKNNMLTDLTGREKLPYLWHSDSKLDISEGGWDGGYGPVWDKYHKRRLFYLKDAGFVICDDRIISDDFSFDTADPPVNTQIWNFMPRLFSETDGIEVYGFRDSEILVDAAKKTIKTAQKDSPNFAMYQFSAKPLEYIRYYGDKSNPDMYLGWFAYSIGGSRWPKTDIHVNFDGASPLITLQKPTLSGESEKLSDVKDLSSGGVSGFSAKSGGSDIAYLSSVSAAALSCDAFSAQAQAALLVNGLYGAAFGCTSLTVGGIKADVTISDFTFEIKNGKIVTTPIN